MPFEFRWALEQFRELSFSVFLRNMAALTVAESVVSMETKVITLKLLLFNISFCIWCQMLKKCLVHIKLGLCKTITYKSHLLSLSVSELTS